MNLKPVFFAKETFTYVKSNRWSWKYLTIPAVINFLLFVFIWIGLYNFLSAMFLGMSFFSALPAFLGGLVSIFIFFVTLLTSLLFFFLLANLIASPFNGLLSEKMLLKAGLSPERQENTVLNIFFEIWRSLKFEFLKLLLALILLVIGLLLGVVPFVGIFLAGIVNIGGNTYLALVDFFDPALSNMKMPVSKRFGYVRSHLKDNFGLFFTTMAVTYIPLVNIVYIPFAVVSSTLSVIEDYKKAK